MNEFLKLSKLYFELNFKVYVTVIISSIVIWITSLYLNSISNDIPFGEILMLMHGLSLAAFIGAFSFNNNNLQMMMHMSKNKMKLLIVFITYPVLSMFPFLITFMSYVESFEGYKLELSGDVGFYSLTILLVVYAFKIELLEKDNQITRIMLLILLFSMTLMVIFVYHSSINNTLFIVVPSLYVFFRFRRIEL